MKGKDLRCECGAGAKDVDPEIKIKPNMAIQWTCKRGHVLISGSRPKYKGFQQKRFT